MLIVDKSSGHLEDASLEVQSRIFKFIVTFACQTFLEIYLRNNLIKHSVA